MQKRYAKCLMLLLDASALLAHIKRELGHEAIKEADDSLAMSAVNYAEVLQKIEHYQISITNAQELIHASRITIIPFSEVEASLVLNVPKSSRQRPLSLADRACLATALAHNYTVLTADRAWKDLGLDLDIQLIR